MTDAAALLERLAARGWTVGVAESLTGGLVIADLIAVPGASACVRGGVIAYATDLKHSLLGVDDVLLSEEGAVHPEVARQMADGVRVRVGALDAPAEVGLATTGVAGPDPQDGRPVGTVHVAVSTPEQTRVQSLRLTGDREAIRSETVRAVLALAVELV